MARSSEAASSISPCDKADGIFLQLREPGVGPVERDHIPARLGQVLDEVEADEARATRDEGGLVRHDSLLVLANPCEVGPEMILSNESLQPRP